MPNLRLALFLFSLLSIQILQIDSKCLPKNFMQFYASRRISPPPATLSAASFRHPSPSSLLPFYQYSSPLHLFLLFFLSSSSFFLFTAAQLQRQQRCANSGMFMQAYCLADYNCNFGRQFDAADLTQRQVCIRGWCCSPTLTPKAQVNVHLQQDQFCPSGTFNVELQCQSSEDCIRSSGIQRVPFPILECGGQGYCCTSSRYRKPLRNGNACLNGGTAIGVECQRADDCANSGGQFGAVCIDNSCCSRSGGGQFDDPNGNNWNNQNNGLWPGSDGLCSNGGHFTNQYCSGLIANECGNLYQMAWTAVCIDGRCCTSPMEGNNPGLDDFDRGQTICAGYRLAYIRRHCQRPTNCGYPSTDFSCLSGYCCAQLGGGGGNWDQQTGWNGGGIIGPGGGIRPNGPSGFCPANGRFSRFMGQPCRYETDCRINFDSRTQTQLLVRCIQNWCCGENLGGGRRAWEEQPWGGGGGGGQQPRRNNRLIPVRSTQGFCYDGSSTSRQCLTNKDCRAQEGCVNNVCCQTRGDQDQYACGGLQGIGRCEANGYCSRGECVSASVCCECEYGQPQLDVSNCRTGGCQQGYVCTSRGFCCPQCPGGGMPYGSCYLGRCAAGFSCRLGNICCQGEGLNELPIVNG